MNRSALICIALLSATLPASAQRTSHTVTITAADVKNANGEILASLCGDTAADFPGSCTTHTTMSPARQGNTTLTFANVPNGRYALQVFHDQDGNRIPAIPPEGYAFGNDAGWPPSFDKAAFTVAGDTAHTVTMQYLMDGFAAPAADTPVQE